MCSEYNLTGVLIATKDKQDKKACSIPESCAGKVLQTKFLDQGSFFQYVKQSRFLLVPQVHDASPRVTTQALALNVPLLMNYHIMGGWKYINNRTGEFFHDVTDFRTSLEKVLRNQGQYEPSQYVFDNFGNAVAGKRLFQFVTENFKDRVELPEGTHLLTPSEA